MKFQALIKKLNVPILRGSFSYTVSSALNALIPFVLIPILTEYLTAEEFGIVSTFMVSNSILIILIGIEQQSFVSVNYFRTPASLRATISNVFFIGLANALVLGLFAIVFAQAAENALQISSAWIILSIGVSFMQFITHINLTLWQLKAESIKYGIFQILNSICNYGISIALIVNLGLNEEGRIWGISVTAALFGLFSLYNLFRSGLIQGSLEMPIIRGSLAFSAPLLPHALAGWVNSGLDRILINNFIGLSETGIYSIGYQIGMAVAIVASSFNRAFAPLIFEKLSSNIAAEKQNLVRYTYVYFALLILFALALYLLAPAILRLFVGDRFLASGQFIGWIIIGFTADGLYYGVVNYIYFSRRTLFISLITFSSCIIHFCITYFLLPSHGAMAAAYSTAITYIFAFILAAVVAQNVCPMPWLALQKKK